MGLITAVAAAIGAIAIAFSTSLMKSEFEAWTPRLVEWLICRAVRRLPHTLRQRMDEEWRAFIADTPGQVMKIIRAWGLARGARSMACAQVGYGFVERALSRALGALALFSLAPLICLLILVLTFERGPGGITERVTGRIAGSGPFSIRVLRLGSGPWSRIIERSNVHVTFVFTQLATGETVFPLSVWAQLCRDFLRGRIS